MNFPLQCGVVKRSVTASATELKVLPRIIGVMCTLLVAVLLQACSAIKVAYNQSPELAYWYLDSYFDFTGTQSLQVKADLHRILAWHRQNELPAYVESMQKLRQQMSTDLSPGQACAVYTDIRARLWAFSQQAEPAIALLATQLDAAQLTFLERKFAKTDAEYRDDYMDASPEASRRKRYNQAVKRAEMLYGYLGETQLAVINRRLDASSFDATMFYAEKQRRQQDTLRTLRQLIANPASAPAAPDAQRAQGAGQKEAQVAVHGLLERTFTSPEPAHRAYSAKLTQELCVTFSDLHNSTTQAQRIKAVEVLKSYEQDLTTLSARKV